MEKSPTIGALALALSKAQAQIEGAVKGSVNPAFRSKYADLAAVWDACREHLCANQLSIAQCPSTTDGVVAVTTMLMHESGEWLASTVSAIPKDSGPQAVVTVVTYLRRVGLSSMVGIPQIDDDAEAGEGRGTAIKKLQAMTPPSGYADWLDALTATADEGSDALKAAWKKSAEPLRLYLTSHGAETLAKLKATAAAVKVGA